MSALKVSIAFCALLGQHVRRRQRLRELALLRRQRRFLDLQGFLRIDHGRLGAGLRGLQGRAHGHPLLQSRDQGLLRGNRLGQALLLGLFLRELRFEALDADRQLAEIAQQNQLLAGAFGGGMSSGQSMLACVSMVSS